MIFGSISLLRGKQTLLRTHACSEYAVLWQDPGNDLKRICLPAIELDPDLPSSNFFWLTLDYPPCPIHCTVLKHIIILWVISSTFRAGVQPLQVQPPVSVTAAVQQHWYEIKNNASIINDSSGCHVLAHSSSGTWASIWSCEKRNMFFALLT